MKLRSKRTIIVQANQVTIPNFADRDRVILYHGSTMSSAQGTCFSLISNDEGSWVQKFKSSLKSKQELLLIALDEQ